ncbi:MAG: glycosyltransferase family 4 protein, partial [Opitutus sp.]
AARCLHEIGQLERFVTAVTDAPASLRQRLACGLGRLAGRDLAARFHRRSVTEVPSDRVDSLPWRELLRLVVGAIDRDKRATDFFWERSERGFDRAVAKRLHAGLTGVYGYEFGALETFTRARQLGLRVAYDVPAPEPEFVHGLLASEMDRFPELRTAYHRHTARHEAGRTARRRAEWHAADVVIAASTFTRRSFDAAGLDVSKVRIVPYGAPPPVARDAALTGHESGRPPTFIWAGTFSIRKGAHHVIEAWRTSGLGRHARLQVYGAVTLPERVLHPLPDGITLYGSVPRNELMEHYRMADALLFPTLCDGFGMVVTEAWSRGVPVITTDRAGAADLLKPNRNGLLIRAGDPAAIGEAVRWCLDHRGELGAMREPALASAAAWQWSDYRRELAAALDAAGLFSRGNPAGPQ